MLPGQRGPAVLEDQQGAPEATLIAVDDDLVHILVVAHVYLIGEKTASPSAADLRYQFDRIIVASDQVSVDVHAALVLPHLRHAEILVQGPLDIGIRGSLGNVDYEGGVLHQTAVLSFRGLRGAESAPLSGVQVTSLEVGLAPRQRRGYPAQVGQSGHARRPVQQLRYTGASADPVTCGEGVEQFVREEVRAYG